MAGENLVKQLLQENGRDISGLGDGTEAGAAAAGNNPPAGTDTPPGDAGNNPPKPVTVPPAGNNPPAGTDTPPAGDDDDVDDEKLKRILKKRGVEVESIEDLKKPAAAEKVLTEEEKAEQKKLFRENAIKHALNKDDSKIKTSDITAYEADLGKTPREIVYPIITAKWKAEDDTLTPEQLAERFADFYAEDKAEDDWTRKERSELMKGQAQFFINKKHEKVLGLESDYEAHLTTIQDAAEYKNQVEKVVTAFPTETSFEFEVEFEGGTKETQNYKYEFSKADIDEVRTQLLSKESFAKLGSGQANEELLNATVKSVLINKHFGEIVKSVARSHANKMVLAAKAGRKGIPVNDGGGTSQDNQPPVQSIIGDILAENKR